MIEITALEDISFSPNEETVVAIGFFDGVHKAHQTIIEECISRAKKRGGKSVVFTFQNHPSSVLMPDRTTPLITPYPLKKRLLSERGIDVLTGIPFDRSLSETTAQDFIQQVLCDRLRAREVVVGFNFRFGNKRVGTPQMLKECVPDPFDDVCIVDPLQHNGSTVSSSVIREMIQQGELDTTQTLLGRRLMLYGEVVHGDGRGKSIGVPTANINTANQALPPNGIYGVRVYREDPSLPALWGAMNIGVVPTFKEKSKPIAEVHILDFDGDIYGEHLTVEILCHIREERKYPNVDALIKAIDDDIRQIRQWLSNHNP